MNMQRLSKSGIRGFRRRRLLCCSVVFLAVFLLFFLWRFFFVSKPKSAWNTNMGVRHVLWWNAMPRNYESTRFCGHHICSFSNNRDFLVQSKAVIMYASNMEVHDFPLPRQANHIWALLHEESPRNVPYISSAVLLQHFNVTATFSRYSDFALTTHYLPDMHELTAHTYMRTVREKSNYLNSHIIFLQSDCDTLSRREDYVRELMQYINIDSYGSCLHNRDLPTQ